MTKIYLPYFILIISLISGGFSYVDTKNYVARYNMARQRLEKENLQLREEREWEIKSKKQKDAEEKDNGLGNSSTRNGFIKKIIREVWGKEAEIGISLAECESKLNPRAFNDEGQAKKKGITKHSSYGIFQINAPYNEKWFDPKENAKEGYRRFKTQGPKAWFSCSKKLGYL